MSRTHGSTGGREAESLHYFPFSREKRGGLGEASGMGTGGDIPEVRKTSGEVGGTPSEQVTSRGSTGVVGVAEE